MRPMLAGMTDSTFAELDALPTEELRERAFARARERRDLGFFWSVFKHLPDADEAATLALGDARLFAPGVASTPWSDVRLTISPDGSTALWFSRNRPGGAGGYDIGARARQIRDGLLTLAAPATEAGMLAIQLDSRALFLARWRDLLLALLDEEAMRESATRREFRQLISDWQADAAPEGGAPSMAATSGQPAPVPGAGLLADASSKVGAMAQAAQVEGDAKAATGLDQNRLNALADTLRRRAPILIAFARLSPAPHSGQTSTT